MVKAYECISQYHDTERGMTGVVFAARKMSYIRGDYSALPKRMLRQRRLMKNGWRR